MLAFIVIFFSWNIYTVTGQNRTDLENLHQLLTSGYEKDVPPGTTNRIRTELILYSINGLDEVSSTFSTVIALSLYWSDDRMNWTNTVYNKIEEMRMKADNVWVPFIVVKNPTKRILSFGLSNNAVRYTQTGDAKWSTTEFLETSCNFDVTHFPFDKQICDIEFLAWMYLHTELEFFPVSDEIDLSQYSGNGIWTIKSTSVKKGYVSNWSLLTYSVEIERRSAFFIITIFIPVVMLVLLNSVVFILPTDSGERVGYSITCLLALAVFLTLMSDMLPRTSKPLSVLSCFLMLLVLGSAAICFMTIISIWIHHKDDKSTPPEWLQKCTRFVLCKGVCKRAKKSDEILEEKQTLTKVNVKHSKQEDDLHSIEIKPNSRANALRFATPTSLRHVKVSDAKQSVHVTEPKVKHTGGQDKIGKESDKDDEHQKQITWKTISELFNFICFIGTISWTGVLGFLYFVIAGGNL